MQKILSVLLILTSYFINGCATAPKFLSEKIEGTWSSVFEVTDKKRGKKQSIDAEVFGVVDQKMRIEMSGLLGTPVASLLIEEKTIQAAVHVQKRAYVGPSTAEALKSTFGVDLDPSLFFAFYFDRSPRGKEWKCVGESGVIKECIHSRLEQKLSWTDRDGENKSVRLESPDFLVHIKIRDFEPKVQNPEKVFKLNIPKSYRQINL
jgi:hypothetical protein